MSKTKSAGQIFEEPGVHSRGLSYGPIVMKLNQNVCLNEISEYSEIGSCGIKN